MSEDAHLGEPLAQNPAVENGGIPTSDFYAMNLIFQMRIYDMLTVIANSVDPDACDKVLEAHANGDYLGPPPRYEPGEE